jgi:hypothetical protein
MRLEGKGRFVVTPWLSALGVVLGVLTVYVAATRPLPSHLQSLLLVLGVLCAVAATRSWFLLQVAPDGYVVFNWRGLQRYVTSDLLRTEPIRAEFAGQSRIRGLLLEFADGRRLRMGDDCLGFVRLVSYLGVGIGPAGSNKPH